MGERPVRELGPRPKPFNLPQDWFSQQEATSRFPELRNRKRFEDLRTEALARLAANGGESKDHYFDNGIPHTARYHSPELIAEMRQIMAERSKPVAPVETPPPSPLQIGQDLLAIIQQTNRTERDSSRQADFVGLIRRLDSVLKRAATDRPDEAAVLDGVQAIQDDYESLLAETYFPPAKPAKKLEPSTKVRPAPKPWEVQKPRLDKRQSSSEYESQVFIDLVLCDSLLMDIDKALRRKGVPRPTKERLAVLHLQIDGFKLLLETDRTIDQEKFEAATEEAKLSLSIIGSSEE